MDSAGGWPFSLTFPGARSGESEPASLSLPPFLDFLEADWPWPMARFWRGAWGEPGAGWDLLLPERREVRTERMVGASLETFPFADRVQSAERSRPVGLNVNQPGASCVTGFGLWSRGHSGSRSHCGNIRHHGQISQFARSSLQNRSGCMGYIVWNDSDN